MQAYYQDYIDVSTHARPIAGTFLSLLWTFRLLNLLIFINFINILLPVDYGYLHNSIYIVNWVSISVFRAGFGRFRPVSLGFVQQYSLTAQIRNQIYRTHLFLNFYFMVL